MSDNALATGAARGVRFGRRLPMVRRGLAVVERRTGPLDLWLERSADRPVSIDDALVELEPHRGAPVDDPVFVLSAGWRSGSTLLQRYLMSSGEALVWGEPWERCGLVQAGVESLTCIGPVWPQETTLFPDSIDGADLPAQWVANLYPYPTDLIEGHRALIRAQLAAPALARGYRRWGMKEVRLGVDAAAYLRFLFPQAGLVLLYRNPYDAWRSYRSAGFRAYRRWPGTPVLSAARFAKNWADMTGGFVDRASALGALLVSYEQLVADPETQAAVADYVGLELDTAVFDRKIGATEPVPLHRAEHAAVARAAGPLAAQLYGRAA